MSMLWCGSASPCSMGIQHKIKEGKVVNWTAAEAVSAQGKYNISTHLSVVMHGSSVMLSCSASHEVREPARLKENLSGETPQRFCYVNYKTYPAVTSFLLVALIAITDLFLTWGQLWVRQLYYLNSSSLCKKEKCLCIWSSDQTRPGDVWGSLLNKNSLALWLLLLSYCHKVSWAKEHLCRLTFVRIIELFMLEKILGPSRPTINLTLLSTTLNHVPKHHIYVYFKYL